MAWYILQVLWYSLCRIWKLIHSLQLKFLTTLQTGTATSIQVQNVVDLLQPLAQTLIANRKSAALTWQLYLLHNCIHCYHKSLISHRKPTGEKQQDRNQFISSHSCLVFALLIFHGEHDRLARCTAYIRHSTSLCSREDFVRWKRSCCFQNHSKCCKNEFHTVNHSSQVFFSGFISFYHNSSETKFSSSLELRTVAKSPHLTFSQTRNFTKNWL